MIIKKILISLFLLYFATCGSMSQRENAILDYSDNEIKKYDRFLVKVEQYTTNGTHYHTKYYRHLIGIARIITEGKNLTIKNNSIGFYYDKKNNSKNKLYIGIDILTLPDSKLSKTSYFTRATSLLKENIQDMLFVINSCKTLFIENEIIGIVFGIHWRFKDKSEMLNIWIDKNDVLKYENNMITLNELIERNIITNTDGKIIRLPI